MGEEFTSGDVMMKDLQLSEAYVSHNRGVGFELTEQACQILPDGSRKESGGVHRCR